MEFNCILVKVSPEVSLKSRFVRKYFLDKLVASIKSSLRANDVSGTTIIKGNGRLFVFPDDAKNRETIFSLLGFVFGIQAIARTFYFEFENKDSLLESTVLLGEKFLKKGTFKVDARRDMFEELSSKQLEEILGSRLLEKISGLKVNLSKPVQTLFLEVFSKRAFVFFDLVEGPGGLPLGCEGNVAVLFEGKKEELASAFLLMKRGCNVFPVVEKETEKIQTHVNHLVKWNSFRSFRFTPLNELSFLEKKDDIGVKAIVLSEKSFGKKMSAEKKSFGSLAVFWPLAFLPKEQLSRIIKAVSDD